MGLSLSELGEAVVGIGEKKFRAKQIFQWLHVKRVFDFEKMTDISAQLRQELEKIFCINRLFIQKRLESSIDNTVKYYIGSLTAILLRLSLWNTATDTVFACPLRWAAKWAVDFVPLRSRDMCAI